MAEIASLGACLVSAPILAFGAGALAGSLLGLGQLPTLNAHCGGAE